MGDLYQEQKPNKQMWIIVLAACIVAIVLFLIYRT
jgi:hypothetical protein